MVPNKIIEVVLKIREYFNFQSQGSHALERVPKLLQVVASCAYL